MSCFIVKKIEATEGEISHSSVGYIDSSDEASFISIHGYPFTEWVVNNDASPQVEYFDTNPPCYVLDTCYGMDMEGLSLITDLNNPEGV